MIVLAPSRLQGVTKATQLKKSAYLQKNDSRNAWKVYVDRRRKFDGRYANGWTVWESLKGALGEQFGEIEVHVNDAYAEVIGEVIFSEVMVK